MSRFDEKELADVLSQEVENIIKGHERGHHSRSIIGEFMALADAIERAAKEANWDPYNMPFKPSDLGLRASDYGSFSDHCSETTSAIYCRDVCLKVAEWSTTKMRRPRRYLLLPLNKRRTV